MTNRVLISLSFFVLIACTVQAQESDAPLAQSEKTGAELMSIADKHLALNLSLFRQDSAQPNTIKIKKNDFSFIGKWVGTSDKDTVWLAFVNDSILHVSDDGWLTFFDTLKWKEHDDSIYIGTYSEEKFLEVRYNGQKWERDSGIFVKFKILKSDEVILYLPKHPLGTMFRKLEQ